METNETPVEPSVNVKQIQPVATSGGRDLAKDLVWQRDPDCSKDPVVSNPVLVSQRVPVNQAPANSPNTTVTQGLHSTGYQYQAPHPGFPSQTGDHVPGSMVQTFQMPQGQNVVTFMPVTNQQAVVMDTDGNRIQSPMMQQGIPGYPMTQNMVPVQFSPTVGNVQYINMPPPSTSVQQNISYPRLIPFNPQTMTLPRPQSNSLHTSPQMSPRPRSLNVTLANQDAQRNNCFTMTSAGTQVSSPVLVSPSVQSPSVASPGTESVKSPTYVFMCNKCNYVTPHRSSFKTHYSSHMQYKPYQCAYCDHATIMKQPMQKHIKLKHAIEDAEGFTYESDSKKEKIIDFHCNQCRSTMSVEEAKNFLAKYESHEKLKPGPAKRKGNKEGEDRDDESVTPSKKKKRFSWSDTDDNEQNDEHETPCKSHVLNTPKQNKSISPRKLTHWKQDVTFNVQTTGNEPKKKGRPRKGFIGKPKKFLGFGKTNKFSSPVSNLNAVKCPYCEFKSGAQKGLKKHCEWRHPESKIKCTKCTYSTFFKEAMDCHLEQNQCDFTNLVSKHERSKSPEKTVGRPRKSISTEQANDKIKTINVLEGPSEENSEESGGDDIQLNCPHCNFISYPLALKRHLFFYHKECDWRCKNCGYISSSKKEVVRHSNKNHPDLQLNIVQTFADISSLLPDTATEQEKTTPPDKDIDENGMDKHRLIDRDYIKTSKKRLVLGKKRVSKIVNTGQLGTEEKLQVTKIAGTEKKRGRKKEGKTNDQNSFVVRPKKLRIAKIGFSCVYCTYAAPLRHQLRLHCYEKHTKHPACLMEFVNSKMAEEEQVCFPRDMAEDKNGQDGMTVTETETENINEKSAENQEMKKGTDQMESVLDVNKTSDKPSTSSDSQSEKESKSTLDTKNQSDDCKMEIEFVNNKAEISGTSQKGIEGKRYTKQMGTLNVIENTSTIMSSNDNQFSKVEDNQNDDVLSCMQNILAKIGHSSDGCQATENKQDDIEPRTLNYVLSDNQNKMNGHKFSNPFSTLIVQLNSTQIKVKDAFEGTLDDVDIYLEKFGVRTLNMDSLTPRQFAVFMKKFGSNLQPLT